ncbi:thiamine biosynthesis protein ThiJ [Candidatus Woesearchaeota archaeon CG10_big_fil_rev_8_21_14_0_10_36_11]|nr:MAG: thiamine biosynthesis protein ThiJ [Candidatus Woesearchaeota archaeon CG10_big_fil_rev_8_21_14_0_10_36_11]
MDALFIVAQEGYQDHEYELPKKILESANINVITASTNVGPCKGNLGGTTEATVALANIDVSDYGAIVFIGGPGAATFQHDVQAHLTAQEAFNRKKVLAAICIAPTILAYAGVLDGKEATVWNNDGKQSKILEENGATFVNEQVVVDGKIVTANGPKAAEMFGKKVVDLMKT